MDVGQEVQVQRSWDHATGSPALAVYPVAPLPSPFEYLALDIETSDGRPEEAERWMRLHWAPPKNYKSPEAIGKHWLEALEKKRERLALLDSAPIVAIALRSESEQRCLHCLRVEPMHEVGGGMVEGFATAREMLCALRNGLDGRCGADTLLVGHNVCAFDLPRLRWSFVREGLRMPAVLARFDQAVFDTMRRYGSLFSLTRDPFVSVSDLLDEFGLPNHKAAIDGSMVPELVREGRVDELISYAMLDVAAEFDLFLRMTGQVDDREPAP